MKYATTKSGKPITKTMLKASAAKKAPTRYGKPVAKVLPKGRTAAKKNFTKANTARKIKAKRK